MNPIEHRARVGEIELTYFEWPGAPGSSEPPLLFAHATGFHARVWDAVIEHFPDRRVLSLDLHGHGRSSGEPITHWRVIIDEVLELLDQLDLQGAVGIGHSMGAHVLTQVASENHTAFAQLVLFDPVILDPVFYQAREAVGEPHPTARRKRDFASAEEMIARFESRDPYNTFERQVFEDYCRFGLLPAANGEGMELACAPEMEASVYSASRSNAGIHESARKVDIPVTVVRAKALEQMDFKSSPTWPKLAEIMPQGTDLYRPDMTHFHPFQDPPDAARIIAEAIAG